MPDMIRRERTPPLPWIRAFESAARQGSFLGAGRELSVSAAAVSRNIRELERSIGVDLFMRYACGVELTAAGRTYATAVTPALRQIAEASAELRAEAQRSSLRVNALPALAQRWLVPRLGAFSDAYPDFTVTVSADPVRLDLKDGAFDVVLRSGEPDGHDAEQIELFGDEMIPVVSPKLAKSMRTPADLLKLTALHDTYWESDWPSWLAEVKLQPPRRWRGLYFTLYSMAVDAAVAGYGVLIGHAALIERELRSGALVAPFGPRVPSPRRYYALAQRSRAGKPVVRAFLDWLRRAAAHESERSLLGGSSALVGASPAPICRIEPLRG